MGNTIRRTFYFLGIMLRYIYQWQHTTVHATLVFNEYHCGRFKHTSGYVPPKNIQEYLEKSNHCVT